MEGFPVMSWKSYWQALARMYRANADTYKNEAQRKLALEKAIACDQKASEFQKKPASGPFYPNRKNGYGSP